MLDQLDLLGEMNQIGLSAQDIVAWNDRKAVAGHDWHYMFHQLGETYFKYLLNVRQKFSMDVFRRRYERIHGLVQTGWSLVEMKNDCDEDKEYPVEGVIRGQVCDDVKTAKRLTAGSKYIVGTDGGRSSVRQLVGIDFETDRGYSCG
ncbi:hypothetical protein EJ08DRAFT_719749 [Tothia fuscella]|uniref:FAD-binding domain-containing protein n=1 Tax=Tothia fuscella TaxID=1048955 RepID=A0A9P4TWP8_9PEZI|nr:hypothetical protein EJ08DRAFT_719749 [Tothia fuscella]